MKLYHSVIIFTATIFFINGCDSFKDKTDAAQLRWNKASAEIKLKVAQENFNSHNYDMAKEALDNSLKLNDKSAQAYILAGKLEMIDAKYAQAIKCFKTAVDLNASLDTAWFMLGSAYEQQQDVIMASHAYMKAFDLDDKNIKYILSVARCYIAMDRLEQARDFIQKNMRANANNVALKVISANIEKHAGNNDKAINYYRQAVLLSDGDRNILKSLGYCYVSANQWKKASEVFRKLLSTSVSDSETKELTNISAICELNSGQYANAATMYDKFSSKKRNNPAFWVNMGQAYIGSNQITAALACSNRAIALNGNMVEAKNLKAASLYLAGEYRQCIKCCENILICKEDSAYAWMMMGRSYEKLNCSEKAKRAYDMSLAIRPDNKSVLKLAGNLSY